MCPVHAECQARSPSRGRSVANPRSSPRVLGPPGERGPWPWRELRTPVDSFPWSSPSGQAEDRPALPIRFPTSSQSIIPAGCPPAPACSRAERSPPHHAAHTHVLCGNVCGQHKSAYRTIPGRSRPNCSPREVVEALLHRRPVDRRRSTRRRQILKATGSRDLQYRLQSAVRGVLVQGSSAVIVVAAAGFPRGDGDIRLSVEISKLEVLDAFQICCRAS